MKRLLFALLVMSLISPGVYGFVVYDIDVQEDDINITTKLELESERRINYWNVVFSVPEGSEVVSMKDSIGEISDYELNGNKLTITTNEGPRRNSEIVTIDLVLENGVDKTFDPLKELDLSLSGFEGEETAVTLNTDERIITTNTPLDFNIERERKEIRMSGTGALHLVAYYSDEGETYNNYVLFGEGDLNDADELNQIIGRTLGHLPLYRAFPVVVLPDGQYEQYNEEFSAANARTGGLIVAREGDIDKDTFTATLLHETTHAYNFQLLNWDNAKSSWFDEGVSSYIEFLANGLQGVTQSEIFGEDVRERNGLTITTYPSRGDADDLWDYYTNNEMWMRSWNPRSSDDRGEIRFGYAFSELQIRDYISKNGPGALHGLYEELMRVDKGVADDDEANNFYLSAMHSDMRACYSGPDLRQKFDECLENVNDMNAEVPDADPKITSHFGEVLNTTKLLEDAETEIERERNQTTIGDVVYETRSFFEKIFDTFAAIVNRIFGTSNGPSGSFVATTVDS